MRKPIKSEYTYEDEFIEMVEDNNYDVNDQFTYMIGIQPENWSDEDTQKAKQYDVDVAGYYVLGNNEGMVVAGTLQDIFDFSDQYLGMGLHPDYVCPVDTFDWEDGEWITGGPEVIINTPYYQHKRERDRAEIDEIMKNWGVNSSRKPIKSETDYDNEDYEYYKNYVQDFDDFEHMKEDLVKERDYFNARKDTPGATKRIRELNAKEKAINEFVNSSRKAIKSGFDLSATEIKDIENQLEEGEDVVELNGWSFVYDYQFDCVIATSPEGKEYDQFRSFTDFLDWYENDYITSSRKPVKSGFDITPEQNKFNWAYNDWYGHFHMNLDRVPQYLEGVKWCDANKGSEFYDELCEKYNIYPTGDRERAAFYNALKELGEIESVTSSKKRRHKTADERAKDEGADITCSRKPIKSSKAKSHESNIEDGCYRLREQVANSTVDYWIDGEDCIVDVVQKNGTTGNSTTWSFCIDFGTNTVYMIEPREGTPEKFSDDYNAFSVIRTMLNGGK